MHTTKDSRTPSYQPASKFDDATLARKREYWRTKKREQRARLSVVKRKAEVTNTGICKSTFTDSAQVSSTLKIGSSTSLLHSDASPTLSSSNGSYAMDREFPLSSVQSGLSPHDCYDRQEPQANRRWFQRVKLKKILPHLQVHQSQKGAIPGKNLVRCSDKRITSVEDVKPNGALDFATDFTVPPVDLKVSPNTTVETLSRISLINGSPSAMSQQTPMCHVKLGDNEKNKPQIKVLATPLTPTELKMNMSQDIQGNRGANTKRKIHVLTAPENEEELAAKRRENWRIKKREQRAKRAEKLLKEKVRTQGVESNVQLLGKHPITGIMKSDEAVKRVTQHSLSIPKVIPGTVRSETVPCSTPVHFSKVEEAQESGRTVNSTAIDNTNAHNQDLKANHASLALGVPSHFSAAIRRSDRFKTQRQRILETQRLLTQRTVRKHLSLAMVLPRVSSPRVETAEEKLARKREYWRIKKREQRAKLSVEVKARMKEQDAMMRRMKRCQTILWQIRRTRAGFHKLQQAAGNMVNSASETIGGFIKEDGTVTVPIQQMEPETVPPVHSYTFTAEVKCPLQLNPSPPKNKATQLKEPSYAVPVDVSKSPKLVTLRARSALHNSQSNPIKNVKLNLRSMGLNSRRMNSAFSLGRPKAVSCAVSENSRTVTKSSIAEELSEEERLARRREYWRIKKREQRANRAAWLTQGLSRGRGTSVKLRQQNRGPADAGSGMSQLCNVCTADDTIADTSSISRGLMVTPTDSLKEEQDSPCIAVSQQTECLDVEDIKPPCFQSPDSESKTESSGSVNRSLQSGQCSPDCGLLEEQLTVSASCKSELFPCKTEPELCPLEDTKTDLNSKLVLLPQGSAECDITGTSVSTAEAKLSPMQCHSLLLTLDSSADDTVLSNQTLSHFCTEAQSGSSTLMPSVSQEPPHSQSLSMAVLAPSLHPVQKTHPEKVGHHPEASGQQSSENSILQRKREYWRFMKRRQRARKAKERKGVRDMIPRPLQRRSGSSSASSSCLNTKAMPVQHPPPSLSEPHSFLTDVNQNHAFVPTVTTHPTVQNVSATTTTDSSAVPLQPSPNNLAKTNLARSPAKQARSQFQGNTPSVTKQRDTQSYLKQPKSTVDLVNEEEILQKKREYWRVKKKEQRAKKAALKELTHERLSTHGRFDLPSESLHQSFESQVQDTNHWFNTLDNNDLLLSRPAEVELSYFPDECQFEAMKDEVEMGFVVEDSSGPIPDAKWRDVYLMDYDPLNQLLLCMVCGEQQHSISLEGAKNHIEEAHPETLSLDPQNRQHILEAWDEQVSMRERFFSSQLLHHSSFVPEQSSSHPAEVEVMVDVEDSEVLKTWKSPKIKNSRKL